MGSNYYEGHGCHGCRGGFRCNSCKPHHDVQAFQSKKDRRDRCTDFGPFTAVDERCLVGPTTPASTGSIIPFASGLPIALVGAVGGLVATSAGVGFGTAFPGLAIVGNTIDLGILFNESFSAPRSGFITAISATFTITAAVVLALGSATIRAEVYRAPAGSTTFTATGVAVDLAPVITPLIAIGDSVSGSATGFNFPVALGDRLMMVFTASSTGLAIADVITGTAGAGITIR